MKVKLIFRPICLLDSGKELTERNESYKCKI